LLVCLGLPFDTIRPEVDESLDGEGGVSPDDTAERLARKKAEWAAQHTTCDTIIGSDTIVVNGGVILGKPADVTQGAVMLRNLGGRSHEVKTAVAVVDRLSGRCCVRTVTSIVKMRDYPEEEIQAYIKSGDYADKAGAYAVQSPEFHPAEDVEGCYLNVVGLPLCELASMLKAMATGLTFESAVRLPPQCSSCRCRTLPLTD